MAYKGQTQFQHGQPARIGVLLTNLGTPEAPTAPALRRYLAQFLADPRVVEIPRLVWRLILHGIILRLRPKRSAAAYKQVWTEAGSPLLVHSQAQRDALGERLKAHYGEDLVVEVAMRYGQPAIADALENLQQQGVRQLLVLPLYPQYSGSTGGSTFDAIAADFTKRRWIPDLRFISHYHDYPPYIEAMAQHIEAHWQTHGRAEKLLLSYHGLPKRFLLQGDPYHCECHKTSRLLAERLKLKEGEYLTTFQSRFGKAEWLKPYTDATLKSLPGEGVKSVDAFCPGFAADCLETLEEIAEENRGYFMEAGGETFSYIPCLNATEPHIEALEKLVLDNLSGWSRPDNRDETLQHQKGRAEAQEAVLNTL
ncbi:ferrochelatase [Marinobacteraceae bacterium S3BR75-40.1]